nr:hypothetical protein [Tanacetum cinerariifolium]
MLVGARVHHPTVHNFRGYTINRASGNYSCLHSFQTKPPFTHLRPPTLLTSTELRHARGSSCGTARSRGKDRGFFRRQDWRTSAPKDEMSAENTYSPETVMVLNTHRTPIQKQPEALLCLVGLSRRYFLGDGVYPKFLHDDDRDMDLFNLIHAPNPTKVKTGTRPRAAHEVPLLTVTASRVIEMKDPAAATDSSGEAVAPEVPPPENVTTTEVAPEAGQAKGIAATGPHVIKERHKRGNDGVDTNAPPKVLRIDHSDSRSTKSTHGGKSLAAMGLGMGSTRPVPASRGALVDVSDPDPLSFADPQSHPTADVARSSKGAAASRDPKLENTSFTSMLRLRFEQEAKLLKKFVAQVARRDKRIQARENEIKNLETLLEAETDMKKIAKGKSAKLSKELENLRALFSDLQMSNDRMSQLVSTLQAQVTGKEKLKAAFEEFKQYKDNRVEQRCAKMDVRLDALSIDFDEELYPYMLTAIAGRRWVIRHGLRLAVMKCEHGKASLSLETIEAYDPEAEAKYIAALHALKDLKYPIVDQLESLKDAPMDVIMASLHLKSDTGNDAPQWIRELRPSSSQLKVPVYPEVRDPTDPWACKEDILLADAIAANVSRAEKKKKCRVVCRTHGVGSAHHARSDGVLVSVPIVAPQGLTILLADAATQTETSDGASLRLLRSSSLPIMHN